MGIARVRALKRPHKPDYECTGRACRNGNSPSKGIETAMSITHCMYFLPVEMGIARVRALLCSLSNDHRLLQAKIF